MAFFFRVGFSDAMMSSLRIAEGLVSRMIERQPWVDQQFSTGKKVDYMLNKRTGAYQQVDVSKTTANRMVNAMLTAYSNATFMYCQERAIDVPIIAWENRDRMDPDRIQRFGTRVKSSLFKSLKNPEFAQPGTCSCSLCVIG